MIMTKKITYFIKKFRASFIQVKQPQEDANVLMDCKRKGKT